MLVFRGASVPAEQVEPVMLGSCVESLVRDLALCVIHLPSGVSGKQQWMAPVLTCLLPTWDAQVEFLAPGFWLLLSFRQ